MARCVTRFNVKYLLVVKNIYTIVGVTLSFNEIYMDREIQPGIH